MKNSAKIDKIIIEKIEILKKKTNDGQIDWTASEDNKINSTYYETYIDKYHLELMSNKNNGNDNIMLRIYNEDTNTPPICISNLRSENFKVPLYYLLEAVRDNAIDINNKRIIDTLDDIIIRIRGILYEYTY